MLIKKRIPEIVKAKLKEYSCFFLLRDKKETSDEECSTFGREDERQLLPMVVRDFKKFFKRRDCGELESSQWRMSKPPIKTKNKEHLSEILGVIAVKKIMRKSITKRV
ncbi:hypothetical protein Tco_0157351 [Tanacetum coccineum]